MAKAVTVRRKRVSRAFHPTDIAVGARIRQRRALIGWSQQRLAAALELTFQQVQKYERGANRVSASMLEGVANALGAPITYFFGKPEEGGAVELDALASSRESLELIRAYYAVSRPVREKVVAVLRAIAQEENAAAGGEDAAAPDESPARKRSPRR